MFYSCYVANVYIIIIIYDKLLRYQVNGEVYCKSKTLRYAWGSKKLRATSNTNLNLKDDFI